MRWPGWASKVAVAGALRRAAARLDPVGDIMVEHALRRAEAAERDTARLRDAVEHMSAGMHMARNALMLSDPRRNPWRKG